MLCINRLSEVGFVYPSSEYNKGGWFRVYKYYPDYLGDDSYTLTTVTPNNQEDVITSKTRYNLYIHNHFGKPLVTIFRMESMDRDIKENVDKIFNETFIREIRESNPIKVLYND